MFIKKSMLSLSLFLEGKYFYENAVSSKIRRLYLNRGLWSRCSIQKFQLISVSYRLLTLIPVPNLNSLKLFYSITYMENCGN